ncbi:phage capsid protein (plasmid) [Azospirillum sp. A26]|uniref:phage capsid protein n=1 Tax=Azospirillum sp. A26 TaxID=3160607 RepID=UPI00366C7A59
MTEEFQQAFTKRFEREVHESYVRMGSKLRHTVRAKNNVQGEATTFQRVGKTGTDVLPLDPAVCELNDFYAGDWVDRLDELKTNVDERGIVANAGAYALGRKTDELIVLALNGSTNVVGRSDDGLTEEKAKLAVEALNSAGMTSHVPRHAIVGWKQWANLLNIADFAAADYVGTDELPWRGTQAKRWLGVLWMPHSGLTPNGNVRICHLFHKNAVGHAAGAEVKTDITWHGDRGAHYVNNMMKQGAALIDPAGVVTMRCAEA